MTIYADTWFGQHAHAVRRYWHVYRGHSLLMRLRGTQRHYACGCGARWGRA